MAALLARNPLRTPKLPGLLAYGGGWARGAAARCVACACNGMSSVSTAPGATAAARMSTAHGARTSCTFTAQGSWPGHHGTRTGLRNDDCDIFCWPAAPRLRDPAALAFNAPPCRLAVVAPAFCRRGLPGAVRDAPAGASWRSVMAADE